MQKSSLVQLLGYKKTISSINRTPDYNDTGWATLSISKVQDALADICGENVNTLSRETRGSVNQVWHAVVGKEQRRVTLKIAPRWFSESLAREARCLDLLAARQISVPTVLAVVSSQQEPLPGHDLLLMNTVQGTPLKKYTLDRTLIGQVLAPYRTLHQVRVERFGWFTTDGIGRDETWQSFLIGMEKHAHCDEPKWKRRNERLRDLLEGIAEPQSPRLLYGDYNRDNFLRTSNGELIALDFQNCFAGDPLYDWATILIKEPADADSIATLLKLDHGRQHELKAYQARILWTMGVFYASFQPDLSQLIQQRFDELVATIPPRRRQC